MKWAILPVLSVALQASALPSTNIQIIFADTSPADASPTDASPTATINTTIPVIIPIPGTLKTSIGNVTVGINQIATINDLYLAMSSDHDIHTTDITTVVPIVLFRPGSTELNTGNITVTVGSTGTLTVGTNINIGKGTYSRSYIFGISSGSSAFIDHSTMDDHPPSCSRNSDCTAYCQGKYFYYLVIIAIRLFIVQTERDRFPA
ncbi:hypothetical protein ACMFMG_003881 [Clarireedia jacksonii]